MLSEKTIAIVKATAPVVAANAEAITRRFYDLMFAGNPEVQGFFNQAHQQAGTQQQALAGSICAYAANIDNLAVLGPAVELIAQKHCSLMIKPEHYPIVGGHLLAAIKDVLGDAVTDEVRDAWAEAYGLLAKIMIERESQIYREQAECEGGWNGYRPFVVVRKERESGIITSFYLKPQDGGSLPTFKPGQFITVQIHHPTTPTAPRSYSLSDRPGLDYYRISVKREPGSPPGLVSNHLHDHAEVGDVIDVGPPCGEFTLDPATVDGRPIVLASGGVGITPVMSMLKTLVHHGVASPIHFVHGTRNSNVHAFADDLHKLCEGRPNVKVHIVYDEPQPGDQESGRCHAVGLMNTQLLQQLLPDNDAHFYFCGPKPFMSGLYHGLKRWGVAEERIRFEFFGPRQELSAPVEQPAELARV
ncbi:MAG: NO-inducible flavohemoprotein [Planctomycetaceae bacterium]